MVGGQGQSGSCKLHVCVFTTEVLLSDMLKK